MTEKNRTFGLPSVVDASAKGSSFWSVLGIKIYGHLSPQKT